MLDDRALAHIERELQADRGPYFDKTSEYGWTQNQKDLLISIQTRQRKKSN